MYTDVKRRATQFLKRAERLVAIAGDRPGAFQAIFGHGALYVSTFPTHEDRMLFRDVPLARAKLFSLLGCQGRTTSPNCADEQDPFAVNGDLTPGSA